MAVVKPWRRAVAPRQERSQAAWPYPSVPGSSPRSGLKSASRCGSYASGWMPRSWVEYSPKRRMCSVRYGEMWARSSGSISQPSS